MGFGEAVTAEALDLLEDLRSEFGCVAVLFHAGGEAFLVRLQSAMAFPSCHRAAQLIGLAGAIVGSDDGDLHDLFLEQRHAQGSFEYDFERRRWIGFRLFVITSAQIRMNHAALNRPGPDNRHFNHQIVEGLWLQARQHRHLRPRLDLEHADGIGAADHFVGRFVFGGDRRERQVQITMPAQQVEAAANRAEHAQGEDIHLEQADRIEVVLVPLNDGAVGHRRVFDRHQGVQRLLGNHKTAGMLRQMPGEADQLPGQAQHPAQHRTIRVEAAFTQTFQRRRLIAPAPAAVGQRVDLIRRQAEGLGHIAHGTGGVIGADHRRQRRTTPAVTVEHVLQDFFAALVLEIDIDVRRLVALFGHETFEQ